MNMLNNEFRTQVQVHINTPAGVCAWGIGAAQTAQCLMSFIFVISRCTRYARVLLDIRESKVETRLPEVTCSNSMYTGREFKGV